MLITLFNVFYILVAVAMTTLILLQQGDGASAGAAFGSGSSGTVFGARGAASFMSKSTAILATIFFLMSLGMAVYLHKVSGQNAIADEFGIMGSVTTEQVSDEAAALPASEIPAAPAEVTAEEVAPVIEADSGAEVIENPEVPEVPAND